MLTLVLIFFLAATPKEACLAQCAKAGRVEHEKFEKRCGSKAPRVTAACRGTHHAVQAMREHQKCKAKCK